MDPSQSSVITSQEEVDKRFWSQFCETVHYRANRYTDATITCKEGDDGMWQQVALREQAPDAHIKSILEVTHNPFTRLAHGSYAYDYWTDSSPTTSVPASRKKLHTMACIDEKGNLLSAVQFKNWREIENPAGLLDPESGHNKAYRCDATVTKRPLVKVCPGPETTHCLSQFIRTGSDQFNQFSRVDGWQE